jgi:MFS family permease
MPTPAQDAPRDRWKDLLSSAHAPSVAVLMSGVVLHAFYVFIVATILPSIVGDLGGLALYAWVTTTFVVGSTAGSAAGAALVSRRGLRGAYRVAALLFGMGSLTCAMAPTMAVLLVGRGIQGLGGGLLNALAYAVIRRSLPEALRARAIALVSGVWAAPALGGPFVGGLFATLGRWRLAFWMAVPLVLAFTVLAGRVLSGGPERARGAPIAVTRLTLLGSAALAVSAGSITGRPWPALVGICLATTLMSGVFILDRRAIVLRLLPTGAFDPRNVVGAASLTMALLVVGTSLMPFVPYFLRTVSNQSATVAGYVGALQALGWTFAALLTAAARPAGARRAIVVAPVAMALGLLGVAIGLRAGQLALLVPAWALVGIGIGVGWAHLGTLMIRAAVPSERDLAAAFISTVQMIALAFGSALTGMVANLLGLPDAASPSGVARVGFGLFILCMAAPLGALFLTSRLLVTESPSPPT